MADGERMDAANYVRTMMDSLVWGRAKLLSAASGMPEAEYGKDIGFVYKSVRGILTHTLATEVVYMSRAFAPAGVVVSPPSMLTEADLPTVESLVARWQELEQEERIGLEGLSAESLDEVVTFQRLDGSQASLPRWQILAMAYQHNLQHRSEAAEALTKLGRSPGDLDFGVYLAATGQL